MADYLTTDTELTSIANAIRTKGGTSASLSYPTEFVTAIQNLPTGGANLQTKSKTYTPTTSQQTDTITPDSGYDGMSSVGVTVNAVPMADVTGVIDHTEYVTVNNQRKWRVYAGAYGETEGWIDEGATGLASYEYNAVPSNTTITPSSSAQTVGGANYMMEGAVTVNPVTSMTLPSTTSSTPTGTRKANIAPSTSQRYLNIPSGYNPTAQYYQFLAAELLPLTITQNGTYNPAEPYDVYGFGTITVDVPTGGSSNLVTGTFTTGGTAGVSTIDLDYSGSGYPIMAVVVIEGGAYVSGSSWYNSVQRYAVGQWTMTKSNMTTTPTYGTSGSQNQGVTTWIYKNSTSSSTSYSRSSAMNTNVYSSSNASNAGATCVRFKSSTEMSVYVNTSSYGLHTAMTYRYYVLYSS